jgi:tRNA(Ile)-lysidine synthase
MTGRRQDLPARILEFCRRNRILLSGDRVLVALSGGPDSMTLLDCLVSIRGALDLTLFAAHVNHGIRQSAGRDALVLADRVRNMGLPFLVRQTDVPTLARAEGRTLEEAGRTERYRLLDEMAVEVGASRIATGHTLTDQAETVLMRIVRGTGPLGLAGISPDRGDRVVRPLLCATREDVMRHVQARGLEFLEDETNRDARHLRNRIRLQLMPLMRALNPRVEALLSELADDSAGLAGFVRDSVRDGIRAGSDGTVRVARALLASGNVACGTDARGTEARGVEALAPYRVLAAFEQVTGAPLGLSRRHVESVVSLARAPGSGGEAHLPRRVVARTDTLDVILFVDQGTLPPGSARRGRGRTGAG